MDNLSNIETVFLSALEKDSAEDRTAFLDKACQGDRDLRQSVERLLQAHPQVGSFLQSPLLAGTAENPRNREGPVAIIGPYKLLQKIGEGGMGTVYMAQQAEPIRRLVAVKIIKPGLDSAEVLARFEAERQALALVEHPNVAKILDAGTTASGLPYFVMELIHGIPITDYCNQCRLSVRKRLELLIPVCQAVEFAHQKGIIHRDLKPSNVMIALYDGRPVPKVIDFGVAKAIDQKLTERTLVTNFGALVGTLEYMSPEQAEQNQLDIDTRSDIYSLGVLLYELLTGKTPLDRRRLQEAGLLEMLRLVREEEPPMPSDCLRSSAELPVLSEQRSMEPAGLARLVRGELDWIVMKTLEKDRNRRYATAAGLADDIQCYLRDEPVKAGPPRAGYRLRKFLKRNRGPLLAAAAVLVALVAGAVGTTLGLAHARQARYDAEKAREDAEKLAQAQDRTKADADKAREDLAALLQLEAYTKASARHAEQIDTALRAWEQHDVIEVEHCLGKTEAMFAQTWEQRYLRALCGKVRRLPLRTPGVVSTYGTRVALSSDGSLVAVAGDRNCLKTAAEVAKPVGTAPAIGPKPDHYEEMVRVYELATGREKIAIRTALVNITRVAFSPNGRQLAFGGDRPLEGIDPRTGYFRGGLQGFVEVFDVATGQRAFSLRGKNWDQRDRVDSVTFSADSRCLLTKTQGGQVSVWEAANGRETFSLLGAPNEIVRMEFSPDGKSIATVSYSRDAKRPSWDGEVWLWDGETGEQKHCLLKQRGAMEITMTFSPDSRRIAVKDPSSDGGQDKTRVCIFDTTTGKMEATLQAIPNIHCIDGLALTGDGILAVRNRGGDPLYFFDVSTDRQTWQIGERQLSLSCCAVSTDGRRVAENSAGSVTVWDVATRKAIVTREELLALEGSSHVPAVAAMAFSPDGRHLAYCGTDWSQDFTGKERPNWLHVLDVDRKRMETSIPLKREGRMVGSLAFSPDGKCVSSITRFEGTVLAMDGATGKVRPAGGEYNERSVMEWNLATGKATSALHVPEHPIARAYVAGSMRIAARRDDGSFYVQDAVSGKEKFALHGLVGPISSAALSRDGRRVATRNGDQTVAMWDLATGREMFTLSGPLGDVCPESFSPDGSRLALVADGNGKVFDATDGRDEWRRQPRSGRANDTSSQRELFIIASEDSRIASASGMRQSMPAARIAGLAFSPDGSAIVSSTQDGHVKILSPYNGQPSFDPKDDSWNPGLLDIVFTTDGSRMATVSQVAPGSGEQTVRLWDMRDHWKNPSVIKFSKGHVIKVVFTGSTPHILTAGGGGLEVWDETGQAALSIMAGNGGSTLSFVYCVAISPDGRLIATGGGWSDVAVWDTVTGEEKFRKQVPPGNHVMGAVQNVCFSPDSRRLVAAPPDAIRVWDIQTGEEVLELKGVNFEHVFLSLDGRRIASGDAWERTRVWDAETGQEQLCIDSKLRTSPGQIDVEFHLLAISPDGKSVVVQTVDHQAVWGGPAVYDTATGRVTLKLKGQFGRVRSLAFSSDGRRMVSGGDDGTVRVWNAATGEEQLTCKGHTGPVRSVAFSWDGQRIVSGGAGKIEMGQRQVPPVELKIWDAVTGKEYLSLKGHKGPVTSVAFSRDGQRIVSGSEDGTVRVWLAPANDPGTEK